MNYLQHLQFLVHNIYYYAPCLLENYLWRRNDTQLAIAAWEIPEDLFDQSFQNLQKLLEKLHE